MRPSLDPEYVSRIAEARQVPPPIRQKPAGSDHAPHDLEPAPVVIALTVDGSSLPEAGAAWREEAWLSVENHKNGVLHKRVVTPGLNKTKNRDPKKEQKEGSFVCES